MNKNKTYLLGGVLLVLVVVAYFLTADRGPVTTSGDKLNKEKEFFVVDSANVDKIEIVTNKGKIVLVKAGGVWKQSEPVDYPVTANFVPAAVENLKNFTLSSIVSTNPTRLDTYGFNDTNKAAVTVFEKGQNKGTFIMGNSGIGASQTYIKRPDNNVVFLADNLLRLNFVKENLDAFRDKFIMSIPTGSIKSIDFSLPGESYRILKDSVNRFSIGSDTIAFTNMEGYLNLLQNMNTQDFYAGSLDTVKNFTASIKVDADKPYELNFLKVNAEVPYYLLRTTNKNQIFKFDEALANSFLKRKAEFLAKQ